MKNKTAIIARSLLLPALLLTLNAQLPTAFAQVTAFTYQGRLNSGGAPAGGLFDFRFRLDADAAGNTILATAFTNAVGVSSGLFTTTIDFGASQFTGSNLWLEVDVKTNGAANYTALAPLQAFTPTPYAIFATTASNLSGTVSAAQISGGLIGNAVLPPSPVFSGALSASSFAGNGANVTNVNAVALNGLNATNFWQLGGNNVAAGQFLGSANNQPVEFWVNNQRAFRLEPSSAIGVRTPNVIGGSVGNHVAPGVYGAAIGGGGDDNWVVNAGDTDDRNVVANDYGTIGGGQANSVGAYAATVAGGAVNEIENYANVSAIGGGAYNWIQGSSVELGTGFATIGGGEYNTINSNAACATIPGGSNNIAGGVYSFAAGQQAQALHQGAFVWADSQNAPFASTANDQFCVRAQGGVRLDASASLYFGSLTRQMVNLFGTSYGIGVQSGTVYERSPTRFSWFQGGVHSNTQNDPGTGGTVLMTLTSSGLTVAGTINSSSDRNVKENFQPVNAGAVLAKVAALPLSEWSYKADEDHSRHLGPMAQDFHAAFGTGADDKHIAVVDEGGVALAAIQGLNEKVENGKRKAETQMEQLAAENAGLKQSVAELKQLVQSLAEKK